MRKRKNHKGLPDLSSEGGQPDGEKDGVAQNSLEDVPLAVDLASINLIEEGHHDESVEDQCEVLGGNWTQSRITATVDIEYLIPWT